MKKSPRKIEITKNKVYINGKYHANVEEMTFGTMFYNEDKFHELKGLEHEEYVKEFRKKVLGY